MVHVAKARQSKAKQTVFATRHTMFATGLQHGTRRSALWSVKHGEQTTGTEHCPMEQRAQADLDRALD
jgi:hypothetical protein